MVVSRTLMKKSRRAITSECFGCRLRVAGCGVEARERELISSVTCELSKHTSHPTNPKAHHWRLVAVMAT